MSSADPSLRLEYAREPDISAELDRELIELISTSFDQPHNAFFKTRRYAQEQPLHRYMLRAANDRLAAHLAVHEKIISVAGKDMAIGGIAEVCVRASERGRGHVRHLLEQAHRGLLERGIEFSFLFGDFGIYGSSGYLHVKAPIRRLNHLTKHFEISPSQFALVKSLAARAWPEGSVDLRGPLF
ncbi:MAG TPA: GNAT family N-acetyltransferase [Polyangiaceae bacterium]|jgi:predicted acetyltransferase